MYQVEETLFSKGEKIGGNIREFGSFEQAKKCYDRKVKHFKDHACEVVGIIDEKEEINAYEATYEVDSDFEDTLRKDTILFTLTES